MGTLEDEIMKKIEVIGTGCMKCKRLLKNVETAVKELGIDAEIRKVDDITEIMDRGVMLTPALAVDGELKVSGRVADVAELKKILGGD
jgi:small redox-active disulfide protein 2